MKELKFRKIDAFTGITSSGNPAGCIYLDEVSLTPGEMQLLARELKGFVNETVFLYPLVTPGNEDFFSLKYYSSECEVDFCGHATIACMYDLIKNDKKLISKKHVTIRTVKGDLKVFNEISNSDSVYITAPAPSYISCVIPRSEICRSLNIADRVIDDLEVTVINGGLRTLIVPVNSLDVCINIKPDITSLKEFCIANEIDIILIFTNDVSDSGNGFRTRVFAPVFGYLEDPATGSGNAAFGYYLLKNSMWDGKILSIEQGPDRTNPNIVKLSTAFSDNEKRVLFGGKATVKIEGKYYL